MTPEQLRALLVGALLPPLTGVAATAAVAIVLVDRVPAQWVLGAAILTAAAVGYLSRPMPGPRRTVMLGAAGAGLVVAAAVAAGVVDLGLLATFTLLAVPISPWLVPAAERIGRRAGPGWIAALVLVVAGWGIAAAISGGGAFGHDESAYLVQSRAWVHGTPDTGVSDHRAPGLSVLAMPLLGLTEEGVRAAAAVMALASLAAVGWTARRMGGTWAPVLAMAAVATGLPYLRRGSEFLTDIPAAGLLVAATLVVWQWLERGETTRGRMILAGLAVAAAFYLRYQSALGAAALLVAAAVTWPRRLRDEWRMAGWAVVPALLALIPHLVDAVSRTGSPLGLVLTTSEAAGRAYLGEGLVDYVRLFPTDLAGPLTALLAVASVAGLVLDRGASASVRRRSRFLVVAAVAVIVPLGIVAHGEARFVFFPMWLLAVDGSLWTERWSLSVSPGGRPMVRAVIAGVAMTVLVMAADTIQRVDVNAENRARDFQVLTDVAERVSRPDCLLLSSYQPQLTWYSSCPTLPLPAGVDDLPPHTATVVIFEQGKRPMPPTVRRAILDRGAVVTQVAAATAVPGDATLVSVNEDIAS